MIGLDVILLILFLHFVSDYVLQTSTMALNKSKSNYWLFLHSVVYTLPFLLIGVEYAVINGAFHFITDWVTSRVKSSYWDKENYRMFFAVNGADQFVHVATLFATYVFLY